MHTTTPSAQDILNAAAAIIVGDRTDALSYARLAQHLDSTVDAVRSVYPLFESLVTDLLTRETALLRRVVITHVDRDPRGGLPSRIFYYALCAIYEQPVARALYLEDPEGLQNLVRIAEGLGDLPGLSLHPELLTGLQQAGMMRADVNAEHVAAVLDVVGAGVALAAPRQQIDEVAAGLSMLLERSLDADVIDTTPGKMVFAQYTATLAVERPQV
jgi:hypothetical protein